MLTGLSLQDLPGRFPGVIIKNSKGYKEVGFRTRPPNGGFLISELARLPAELVGNLTELVRLPADSPFDRLRVQTCPPAGGFRIYELVRLLAELVRLLTDSVNCPSANGFILKG